MHFPQLALPLARPASRYMLYLALTSIMQEAVLDLVRIC